MTIIRYFYRNTSGNHRSIFAVYRPHIVPRYFLATYNELECVPAELRAESHGITEEIEITARAFRALERKAK